VLVAVITACAAWHYPGMALVGVVAAVSTFVKRLRRIALPASPPRGREYQRSTT